MILNEYQLEEFCNSILNYYCIFVEEEKTVFDDFKDLKTNSKIYNKNKKINYFEMTINININSIQINLYRIEIIKELYEI